MPPLAMLLTQERRAGQTFLKPGTWETMPTFHRAATIWLQQTVVRLTGRPSVARESSCFPNEADHLDFDMNIFF